MFTYDKMTFYVRVYVFSLSVQRMELGEMKAKVESSSEVTQEVINNKMKNLRKQMLKLQGKLSLL